MKSLMVAVACLASLAIAGRPPAALTETIYSCASALTEYLTLTVALVANSTETQAIGIPTTTTDVAWQPVPTTTTDVAYYPVTLVETVTTTIFNVSVTTIIPHPVTQTSTTSTTTSETIYPVISTWTTTEQVSLTICESRTINPTFTAQYPIPTEFTWGCPPGYLCKPDQINCNFEAGLPADDYYCRPDQCEKITLLGVPQEWGAISSNFSPVEENLRFNVIDDYFNMNPDDYGLSYDVFVKTEAFTFTSTIGYAPTATVAARQAETSVPAECYPWCNNCLIEAQSMGKTPALCTPGSAFEQDLTDCQECISYHASDTTGSFVKIAPQFQQFLAYCNALSAPPPSPTPPVTIYSTSIFTVQPELSSTATITYSTTSTNRESGSSSTVVTSSFTSTITSAILSPMQVATSSSTEWLVPSGSVTIVFNTSPAVTTQWTMVSSSSTIIFASSPVISASVIMYGANGTSTIPLLTSSTTSATTSSVASVSPVSGATSASTSSSSGTKTSSSSTGPASSTFTGVASRNAVFRIGRDNGLFSILCIVLLAVANGL